MELIKIRQHRQITLPKSLLQKINTQEGDYLQPEITDKGILLKGVKTVPADQEYFWTPEWQAEERKANKDIAEGRISELIDTKKKLKKYFEDLEKS